MTPRTIHNIGFLYCCGHRCASVGSAATKLYIELRSRGLAPESPDMDRPIDTICGACWEIPDNGKLLVQRAQVLRTVLTKEQSHSLIVMLYRLADRILEDDETRTVHVSLLAYWTARVAEEYPEEHLDALLSAIKSRPVGSTIHRLVVNDALLSIHTWRAPSDTPPLNYLPDEACVCRYRRAVARFDRRARRLLRWSVWRPWPAVVGPLLTDIARAGVLFAAMFKANTRIRPPHWDEDPSRFPPLGDRVHAEHERLEDAVHRFKVECYSLFHDATYHPLAATRNELRAVVGSVRIMDMLLERVMRFNEVTLSRYEVWCEHGTR